jgi:hypothetical protein
MQETVRNMDDYNFKMAKMPSVKQSWKALHHEGMPQHYAH